jgi:hypothetical protein
MKQLFRAVTLVLLVGGWTLAGSALHVVRTPTNVALLPKDRLSFHDTWVDTRKWTLTDDQAHAELVARFVHLGRSDLLRHTLPTDLPTPVAVAELDAIAAQQPLPGVATSTAPVTLIKNAQGEVKNVVDLAKSKTDKF